MVSSVAESRGISHVTKILFLSFSLPYIYFSVWLLSFLGYLPSSGRKKSHWYLKAYTPGLQGKGNPLFPRNHEWKIRKDWLAVLGLCDHPELITDQDDVVLWLASLSHMLPAVACGGRKAGPVVVLWTEFFFFHKKTQCYPRKRQDDWYQRHLRLAWQANPVGDPKGVGVCAGLLVVQRKKASQWWPAFLLLTGSSGRQGSDRRSLQEDRQHLLFGSSKEHNSAVRVLTAAQMSAVWCVATFYFSRM